MLSSTKDTLRLWVPPSTPSFDHRCFLVCVEGSMRALVAASRVSRCHCCALVASPKQMVSGLPLVGVIVKKYCVFWWCAFGGVCFGRSPYQ